jgi:hypothetical protein
MSFHSSSSPFFLLFWSSSFVSTVAGHCDERMTAASFVGTMQPTRMKYGRPVNKFSNGSTQISTNVSKCKYDSPLGQVARAAAGADAEFGPMRGVFMFRMVLLSAAAFAALNLGGCASIVNGQNQSLSVTTKQDGTDVSGAKCSLANDKGTWYITTPGSVTVHRSFQDLAVKCAVETQEPTLATFKSATKGMAFGNILLGGIVGAGVDMATGAAYDYPEVIVVTMGSKPAATMPAASGSTAHATAAAPAAPAPSAAPAPVVATAAAPAASAPQAAPDTAPAKP